MQELPPGFQLDTPPPPARQGGFIPSPGAAQRNAREQTQLEMEAERLRLAQAKAEQERIEFEQKQAKLEAGIPRDISDVRSELQNVVGKARRAKELSRTGWFATGFGSDTAGGIAGTSAADVQALLDTIGGNIAFDRLSRMRAESPTGGALGNVTERELQLLQSTVSSLSRTQSDEQFQAAMDDVIAAYERVLAKLPGEEGVAPQAAQKPFIPGIVEPQMVGDVPRGSQVELGADSMGQDNISRGQNYFEAQGIFGNDQARITAFWNANRGNPQLTVDNVKAWYAANGYEAAQLPDADLAAYVEQAKKGDVEFVFDTTEIDDQYRDTLDAAIEAQGINPEDMGRSALAGASSGATLGWNDEIFGALAAADEALKGGDIIGAYEANRDLRRRILERAREENPGVTFASELAGGFAIPVAGSGKAVAKGGQAAVKAATKTGAVVGGVAGAGYGEGASGTALGTVTGAALGGALGGQTEKFLRGRRLANIAKGRNNPPPGGGGGAAIQAADNLNAATGSNIRLLPADVAGPGIGNATGGAAKMTISSEILGRAGQKLSAEAEKAKNALVSLAGGRAEPEIAGERALEGARKWMKTTATKRDALYAKARQQGGDEPVDLANARQVLDGHIAELSQTPGSAAGLERLKALRAELDRPFPVEGVKRMRTRLRDDFGGDGLRATDIERRVGQVIDAAEDDIVASLQRAGKGGAATAYREAAKAHRERVEVIDNVLVPIIGAKGSAPRSGEQIIASIEQASRGNSARLGEFMRTLPPEDAGIVRGTIIDRLGRATAGQQDDTSAAFSLNTFLTNWSKMSDRAKGTMFSGELRAALNDLAKVASARRDSGRFVNFSNTGSTIGNIASGGALVGSATNPATLGLFAIDGLTGLLLSSPKFARWLAKMPANPAAQRKHIEGLSRVAAADASIAADALGLQQQLLARFGPDRLAAEPSEGSPTTGSGTQ